MSVLEEELARQMNALQRGRFYAEVSDRWDWFARWRLESVNVDEHRVVSFIWRDPDGQLYGWRWRVPERAGIELGRSDMDYLFAEDLSERDPAEPDANGVRWLGVRPRAWDD